MSSEVIYICDVCGEAEAAWDGLMYDVDMYCCSNGHYFHENEAMYDVSNDPAQVVIDAGIELAGDEDDSDLAEILIDLRCEMPPSTCQVCQMEIIRTDDLLMFATIEMNTTAQNLVARFKNRFETFEDFKQWRETNFGKYTGHPISEVSN